MSHYIERWCAKHGEWDDDVDSPSEGCPACIEDGSFKTRAQLERELDETRAKYERLQQSAVGWQEQLAARPEAVTPEGWKLVPIEPTPAMLRDGPMVLDEDDAIYAWKHMLERAPSPQSQLQKEG